MKTTLGRLKAGQKVWKVLFFFVAPVACCIKRFLGKMAQVLMIGFHAFAMQNGTIGTGDGATVVERDIMGVAHCATLPERGGEVVVLGDARDVLR